MLVADEQMIQRGTRPNTASQLNTEDFSRGDMLGTVRDQLIVAQNFVGRSQIQTTISRIISFLQICSCNELRPAIAAFTGLGSMPHNLYNVVSFDQLH